MEPAMLNPEIVEWSPVEAEGLPAGAMIKILKSNPETGAIVALVKFPAGYLEPKHYHPAGHHILILEGQLEILETGQKLSKGMYFYAPKEFVHGPVRVPGDEDCIFFLLSDGPLFPLGKP